MVVTGEDLPAYLTDPKRRSFFHPELQAEIQFGIDQSRGVESREILDNFEIFLEHEAAWEEANEGIIETREATTQESFPAMKDLADVVKHEIAWQTAMWNEDYGLAYDAAREVLGGLNDSALRGYRALWHYLAGSAAEMAASKGEKKLAPESRKQFKKAKECAAGIPWLVALARTTEETISDEDQSQATMMTQVEQLETYLTKQGTVHNRAFTAREKEIREKLKKGSDFEQGQVLLGEHLGFTAGKRESDASPDPWWLVGNVAIVFEDHANAKGDSSTISADKARQAASHPEWLREHVPATADAEVFPVLVTPATKAKSGATPHLNRVWYWGLDEFRDWAEEALVAVRELRRSFVESGDLEWRAKAAEALISVRADAPGLTAWLSKRPARKHLSEVK